MKKTSNQKKITIAVVSIFTLVALVGLFYVVSGAITKYTGYSVTEKVFDKEAEFKSCLNEKDITLYLNTNDASATKIEIKNIITNEYLDSVKIFNCNYNNEVCIQKGINGPFPVWVINNNKIYTDISLEELQTLSGCSLE